MARAYKPAVPFTTPLLLFVPTAKRIKGVNVKTYPDKGEQIFGSFRTFGGTEVIRDGIYITKDTAVIDTWYRPDIVAECRIALADNPDDVYEIIGRPEDVGMRHQFMTFKVERLGGGA